MRGHCIAPRRGIASLRCGDGRRRHLGRW